MSWLKSVNWKKVAEYGYKVLKIVTGGKIKVGGKTIPLPSETNTLPVSAENPLGLR